MSDPRLADFTYPGDDEPAGVIERGLRAEVVAEIGALAEAVGASLEATGHRQDCRYACAAWERALRSRGVACQLLGGEGADGEVFTSDYRLVAVDQRGGYRAVDRLARHYWLGVGPDRLVFDPTAHQFDHNGGVFLDRYMIGSDSVVPQQPR